MRNIKLTIAYNGKNFKGWQSNKMGPSIEETLNTSLEQVLQQKITLQAASRTDSGVHARGQIVNFFTEKDNLDLEKLLSSLNSLLPSDIAITGIEEASEHFHPSLDCISKEYHYYICNCRWQHPINRHTSWHCPQKLDVDKMKQAAKYLIGKHDFSAFCNIKKKEPYDDYVRIIFDITIEALPNNQLRICIRGNKFLYKMVRNIVGTLAFVGMKKITVDEVKKILTCKKRTKAGITAPAHGLFLHAISYS